MKNLLAQLIEGCFSIFRSLWKFVTSSVLSLLIIAVIFLLLTQMEQAPAMVISMIESEPISMLLSFFLISGLAISLSHFPIYNYFAAHLNNTKGRVSWVPVHPFKKNKEPGWFRLYVFDLDTKEGYRPDLIANVMRYFIGLLVLAVWMYVLISSFELNLKFNVQEFGTDNVSLWKWCSIIGLIIPFILYVIVKARIHSRKVTAERLRKTYIRVSFGLVISTTIFLALLVTIIWMHAFSQLVLLLLVAAVYALVFHYVFFRLARARISSIVDVLLDTENTGAKRYPILAKLIGIARIFQPSKNYLLLFYFTAIISVAFICYSILAAIYGFPIANGIPIVLAYLYVYSFLIATFGKYFLVSRRVSKMKGKEERVGQNTWTFILACGFIFVLSVFFIVGRFTEKYRHQLDMVPPASNALGEEAFIAELQKKPEETIFFVASHGGGLKANVWTLNVLQELQQRTNGRFMNQSVALSGASGGQMGLGLYTALHKEYGNDFDRIQSSVDKISAGKFTSLDLSIWLGPDALHALWPFNGCSNKDRTYRSMVQYESNITGEALGDLDQTPYRDFWRESFQKTGYFPSLIVNTSATDGRRGILWSIETNRFDSIYFFAKNLADLRELQDGGDCVDKTLSFYNALSMTNRFPVLSPAAKIKHYGHFMDAGAIDNSGLLSCLDLYNYLRKDSMTFKNKRVVFVEIINSRGLYTYHVLQQFEKECLIDDEDEATTLMTNINAGLNLDKIPGYLRGFMNNWKKHPEQLETGRDYIQIYLPYKISIEDVESVYDGKIAENIRARLDQHLKAHNDSIRNVTEGIKGFNEPWEHFEPALSRHLSKSNINYMRTILQYDELKRVFDKIEAASKK